MKTYFWKKYRVKKIGDNLSVLNQKTPFWKPFLLILPSFLTISLFTIIPFILLLVYAFTVKRLKADEILTPFKNFSNVFKDYGFTSGLRNSFVYALTALPLSLIISILISVAITQVVKKWARGFWQTVFFLPYVTSAIAVSITFYQIFKSDITEQGIINSLLKSAGRSPIPFLTDPNRGSWLAFIVILIRGVWGNLAFQILILTTAMLSVDKQLYKAASIDGANKTKQFFTITLPSINKTISFLITIGIINGIKVMPLALFNNDSTTAINNGGSSLMLYIYDALTKKGNYSLASAASIIFFIFGILTSLILRKTTTAVFKLGIKIGERNVIKKIETKKFVTKPIFKI